LFHRRWLLVLPVFVGLAGCSTHGLAFVQDDRVNFIAPLDRTTVTLPLTVRWTAAHIPSGATFGVVADAAPPRPGHVLAKDADVVRTTHAKATLDHLGPSSRSGEGGLHRITVFLLDANGTRLGESAWRVDVHLKSRA
jgi:hypothetical protein